MIMLIMLNKNWEEFLTIRFHNFIFKRSKSRFITTDRCSSVLLAFLSQVPKKQTDTVKHKTETRRKSISVSRGQKQPYSWLAIFYCIFTPASISKLKIFCQSLIYDHLPDSLTMVGLTLVMAAILGIATRDLCVNSEMWVTFSNFYHPTNILKYPNKHPKAILVISTRDLCVTTESSYLTQPHQQLGLQFGKICYSHAFLLLLVCTKVCPNIFLNRQFYIFFLSTAQHVSAVRPWSRAYK